MLVAGLEHRGVRGVLQRRSDEAGHRAEPAEQLLGLVLVEVDAGGLAEPVEQLRTVGVISTRPLVLADPGHGLGQPGDRVVVVDLGAVPGAAVGDQPQPVDALLGGLQEVEAHRVAGRAVHSDGEPADLADGLGDAVEQVAAVLHQPVAALDPAGLLVGEEGEDQVARRPASERARSRMTASIIASMSFMSTAPRPQRQPSRSSPANGSTCQSAALAGTTSRWPCTISAPRSAVPAGSPSMRTTTVARPGSLSISSGSSPTSVSRPITYSAASRSPGPEPSP